MKHAKLSEHKFKKGKFISPWNDMDFNFTSNPWFKNRFPEYLWIGLILQKNGREEGLRICGLINQFLKEYKLQTLCFSEILCIENKKQDKIWEKVIELAGNDVLSPITIFITFSNYPSFASHFSNALQSPEDRLNKIGQALKEASDHQSYFSTDIRFVVMQFLLVNDRLRFVEGTEIMLDALLRYPMLSHESEDMHMIRPMIRSAELSINEEDEDHKRYINKFWEAVSVMTDCKVFTIQYDTNVVDADIYLEKIKNIMTYYSDIFVSAHPLDNRMLVLLGITTYSYKRVLELVNCNLFNEISGRSIVRVLIENYIMMKYLIKHETEHDDIWNEYQYYGIGQYKLIVKRFEDFPTGLEASHVDYKYLGLLINEFTNEDFIDMDTNYFDNQRVREKAIDIGEKELFGLYYDYDSAFEHGLWGAIRESSLLKCDASGHQYHCVPDVDNVQKLKSVWHDAKMMMTKTLLVLKDEYGLPEQYDLIKEDENE